MTARTTPEAPAAAPLLDLGTLVASVRRRRRLWSATTLLGLVLGTGVAVFLPPPPTATTKLLVAHQEDQPNDPGTLIRTDVALLQTTKIAAEALRSLKSADRPEDFLKDYGSVGLTNNVLEISVSADSDAEAVARAQALADTFIEDHVRRIREAADSEAKALLDHRDRLRGDLAEVNRAIGERSSASGASADMESLFARRAELTSQIADYGQRAAAANIGTPHLIAGTQIVDAPRAVRHSLAKAAATDAGIGIALGLALGLAAASVASVVVDRPVLRRDIAANLGASVVAELPRHPSLWRRRRRTRAARERLVSFLARTVRTSEEPVSLLELGCASEVSTLAMDLARALTARGPVVVVDGLPGPQLAEREGKHGDPIVVDAGHAAPVAYGEFRLGVGSVAPGAAWTDLPYLGTRTVLVVRAGVESAAWLHNVARQLADQRVAVLGVVLIDPDPRDRTDGTLWDGTQAALRARGERAAGRSTTERRRPERVPFWATRGPDDEQEVR
ncbi:Wzz/FepE/Etk N-terminal domain-containing protein [Streptomyces sp. NPDC020807]|uniref:Wzz/FepE/Etk N-terminal domain-containing protein n=1 Tax=Streptomyces sp. NPDC020807 TaxID=3155119 RepID=UPI00341088CC